MQPHCTVSTTRELKVSTSDPGCQKFCKVSQNQVALIRGIAKGYRHVLRAPSGSAVHCYHRTNTCTLLSVLVVYTLPDILLPNCCGLHCQKLPPPPPPVQQLLLIREGCQVGAMFTFSCQCWLKVGWQELGPIHIGWVLVEVGMKCTHLGLDMDTYLF